MNARTRFFVAALGAVLPAGFYESAPNEHGYREICELPVEPAGAGA